MTYTFLLAQIGGVKAIKSLGSVIKHAELQKQMLLGILKLRPTAHSKPNVTLKQK